MSVIDSARGTPQGHTATSNTAPKNLRTAALATATVMAMSPMAAQNNDNEKEQLGANSGHKIEVPTTISAQNTANTINFFEAESQSQSQTLNPENINVTYEDEHFVIEGSDGSYIMLHQDELNARRIERAENREHNRAFRKPDNVDYKIRQPEELREIINNQNYNLLTLGEHAIGTTNVTIYRSPFSKEEIQQGLNKAHEEANNDDILFWTYYNRLSEMQENPELEQSLREHEISHLNDDRIGAFKNSTLTKEQQAQIGMLTEIKANITEAYLGYQRFLETGNTDDIKPLHAGDLAEFKEWLKQNPDKIKSEECTQRLVQAVQAGWLEKNNQEGSLYYIQTMQNLDNANTDTQQIGALIENHANKTEYANRVNAMFANTNMGDISAYINPNFIIGNGANYQTQNTQNNLNQSEQFLAATYGNAQTVRESTENTRDFLNIVRSADKDGERTPQEQQQINQMIANVCTNAKTLDQKTKDGITIARKTGRGWQNRISHKTGSGRTIENTNVNESSSITLAAAHKSSSRE